MRIVRVWKGYKEMVSVPYFIGQEYVDKGRLKGTYKDITKVFDTEVEAIDAMRCDECPDESIFKLDEC